MRNFKNILKGDSRTVKAKKNIIVSVLLKGIDSIVYLLLVPVTLGYLNQYEYGIWLTLNSILMWINSFDIGLGNGMRNKLAIAIAKDDRNLGRIYVSTTFYMLIMLMGALIVIGTICEPFIDWYGILGTTSSMVPHLNKIVYVAFTIFTPGMRIMEKEAVKIGGGTNHRIGLFDMILIKDNHIDFAGGIEKAIEQIGRAHV